MDPRAIFRSAELQRRRARVHALDAETLEEQITLACIPAPPFGEAQRGDYVSDRFQAIGLTDVVTDEVGNVIGRLPVDRPRTLGAAPLLLSAHLDTVFPAETPLRLRRNGERISVPGIADNARGLAALLTLARVLVEDRSVLGRPLVFVATVGEEGIGDLRGVKHLFRDGGEHRDATGFISIDGSGLRRIVHRGVGSLRFRVTLEGAGGHSWSDWGIANPLNAAGLAIAELTRLEIPQAHPTTLTVARCGGGTSVNAIPERAWLELDLRSEDPASLDRLDRLVRAAVRRGSQDENRRRRRKTPALRERWERIGARPAGVLPEKHPLLELAVAATSELGYRAELAASSTDSNVPLARRIPALTIGAGGESGGIHTVEEWYSNTGGAQGIERVLLLVAAATHL
jgi:tripeptide aminopeptidase